MNERTREADPGGAAQPFSFAADWLRGLAGGARGAAAPPKPRRGVALGFAVCAHLCVCVRVYGGLRSLGQQAARHWPAGTMGAGPRGLVTAPGALAGGRELPGSEASGRPGRPALRPAPRWSPAVGFVPILQVPRGPGLFWGREGGGDGNKHNDRKEDLSLEATKIIKSGSGKHPDVGV